MSKKIILGLAIVLVLSFCATGIVGATIYEETQSSLREGNLFYGMRSGEVKELQQRLSEDISIYPEKLTTGYFGLLTQKAVKRFQEKRGMLQTGIVNKYLKELIWNWDVIPESIIAVPPTFLPTGSTECNKQCSFKGYGSGICRMSCYTWEGEVNISKCHMPCPPGMACATVEYYCCCGNKDGGDSGDCTDSDGGINKYVKGTTCQPSRIVSSSAAESSITKLFCKTDMCDMIAHAQSLSTSTSPIDTDASLLLEYYCKDGKMMSKHIKCENGCKDGACLKVIEEDCTLKGERDHYPFNCCSGLVPRSCNLEEGYPEPISVKCCIACGDGICEGEFESDYNCPEDCEGVCHKGLNKEDCESFDGEYKSACKESGDCHYWCECPCKTDSDCGVNRCSQGRPPDDMNSTCCYESTYKCVDEKCEYTSKEYRNYSCAAYYDPNSSTPEKCLDTCGDGVCKSPENKLWCPEDCKGCVGDGEVKTPLSECCAGLHVIASGYRNNISYCTSEICGNGKCQALENEWNCKQDCKKQTVDIQPVINMIKQAIEKLNSAIRLLGDLI